jgi:serine/threonine protein phosphatase 1
MQSPPPDCRTMISRFFKSRQPEPSTLPEIPPGQRIYAIGDVHGRLDLLDDLLMQIGADNAGRRPSATTLLFLGDLVDRGPDSAGVVERVRKLAASDVDVRVLMGNHEEVFLAAVQKDLPALRFCCRIGGRETIISYGISQEEYERLDYAELAERLAELVPPEHIDFMASFEDVIVAGGYAFVHAGFRPNVAIADQRQKDMRWIREPFLEHEGAFEAFVVHGHTILEDIDERANRIGIDTGAYATGKLTALGLEGVDRWVLQTKTA